MFLPGYFEMGYSNERLIIKFVSIIDQRCLLISLVSKISW